MDNMRHILIAGLTENKGGLESYIMNIYRNCDRDKVQFDFAVFGDKKIAYTDEIKSLGGRVFHIPRKKQSVKEHYGMMKKIFENTPYEAVYFQFNMKPLSLDLFRYAKKYGVKKRIIHSHNTTEPKMSVKDRIREKLADMKLDKYVNYRFACSYDAGKWMFGNRDYKVIPNCVNCDDFKYDTDRRNAKRRELGLENKYVIGTVGRLQPAKNPEYIIDIINECVKIDKECVLVHIGDGNLKDNINNKVEKLHLEDNVKMLGARTDISEFMNAMDAFILPSLHEGFPIVLVEAQATGLRCYVADNITRDCNITGNVKYLPIDVTPEVWAETIAQDKDIERRDMSDIVRKKGYDIKTMAEEMEKFFLS